MDEIRAAYEADTTIFEEYKARVGLHPAAVVSEIVNLIVMADKLVFLREVVDNLLDHVVQGFKLDPKEVHDFVERSINARTVGGKRRLNS